jgi:hypothetical protein
MSNFLSGTGRWAGRLLLVISLCVNVIQGIHILRVEDELTHPPQSGLDAGTLMPPFSATDISGQHKRVEFESTLCRRCYMFSAQPAVGANGIVLGFSRFSRNLPASFECSDCLFRRTALGSLLDPTLSLSPSTRIFLRALSLRTVWAQHRKRFSYQVLGA